MTTEIGRKVFSQFWSIARFRLSRHPENFIESFRMIEIFLVLPPNPLWLPSHSGWNSNGTLCMRTNRYHPINRRYRNNRQGLPRHSVSLE